MGELWLVLCLLALLLLPGLAALRLAGDPSRGAARLARALGLGILLWPLVLLWSSRLGLTWSGPVLWAVLASAAVLALSGLPWRELPAVARRLGPAGAALGLVLLTAGATRWLQARGLVAPPWVDGYHHSLVTQLVLDAGGLPRDYRPYLDVEPFYYHFGFHGLAAAAVWLSGADLPRAVLGLGQLLNAAAALTTYALAEAACRRRLPAVLAAAVPASLFYLPAYFLSWGRYTQLCGLVALPVAWLLLHRALASRSRRSWLLAALASAGLLLVHYRVMAFYAVGASLILLGALFPPREAPAGARLEGLRRFALVAAGGLALDAPWLLGGLARGIASLAAASPDWVVGTSEIANRVAEAPPDWLFTWGSNGLWIRLALIGLVSGLLAGRRAAWGLGAGLLVCLLLVAPGILGLPTTWLLPPFALAISLFLPVALGLALLADLVAEGLAPLLEPRAAIERPAARSLGLATAGALAAAALPAWWQRELASPLDDAPATIGLYLLAALLLAAAARRAVGAAPGEGLARTSRAARTSEPGAPAVALARGRRPEPAIAAAAAIVLLALLGARDMRQVVRDETILVQPADLAAARWLRDHSPPGARVLISTAHWHLGTWRGLDGGYWLPLLAGRQTTMPAALYTHGRPALVHGVGQLAEEVSRGDALSDAELSALMDRAGAGWLYIGPASAGHAEAFTPERLRRHPELIERYARGGVWIFERPPAVRGRAAHGPDPPRSRDATRR